MLRFVFWTLLFLNAAIFAYSRGYLGSAASEHEPERLKRQLNTTQMTMLSNEQADALAKQAAASHGASESASAGPASASAAAETAAASTPAPDAAKAAPAAEAACVDVGIFDAAGARRFETRLAPLDLGSRMSRVAQQEQDVSSYLVHIPPQGSKEAAEHKANELRNLGVTNFYILQGDSPLRWAISLGVFRTESGAQTLLAQLNKQGVRTARITPRGPQTTVYTFRVRDIPVATRARIVATAASLGAEETHDCR